MRPCAHLPYRYNGFVATCRLWTNSGRVVVMRGVWVHWIVFMVSLYMYYALCFVHIKHSACHEPIFVLINIYIYIYIYIYICMYTNICIYIHIYIIENQFESLSLSPLLSLSLSSTASSHSVKTSLSS